VTIRQVYLSKRGMPLLYDREPWSKPVVTVENYCKWYELYVVHPDWRVEAVPFPDEGVEDYRLYDTLGPPYLDHAPNPRHVARWAARNGYYFDDQAEEMMIGRWEIEYRERKDYPADGGYEP
jgi:hypothetical protein